MKIFSRLLFVAGFVGFTLAGEWDCSSTSGVFDRSTECTMTDEVTVSGDLTVTGNETVYTKLLAATGKRHFKISSGTPTLKLKWLNMTAGSISSGDGGSILVDDIGSQVHISHCIFHKNHAQGSGGAIFAKGTASASVSLSLINTTFIENSVTQWTGGGVYLRFGTLNSDNAQFIRNSAKYVGGLAVSHFAPSRISNNVFTLNTAVKHSGGVYMFSDDANGPSTLNISRTAFNRNKVTAPGQSYEGGGGIYIQRNVVVFIRECSFIQNAVESLDNGQQVFTEKDGTFTPAITLIKTNFTNSDDTANNFFGYDGTSGGVDKYINPATCASSPCIVSPFVGTCTARTNTKGGVLCDVAVCPTGEFRDVQVTESLLPPPDPPSCSAWSVCTAGEFVSLNGTGTTNRVCTPCSSGDYSTTNNEDSCTPWTNCTVGQYIATNGTSTADRACISCSTGKYSMGANEGSCIDWTACVAGQKVFANGTTTTDNACVACSTGKFSTALNQNTCANWTICNVSSEVELSAGFSTADRVCVAAESPSPFGNSPSPLESPSPSGNSSSPVGRSPSPAENSLTTGTLNELSAAHQYQPQLYLCGVLLVSVWFGIKS